MATKFTPEMVSKDLRQLGFPVIGTIPWRQEADGAVKVTEAIHVQVGLDYLSVLRQNPDGTFEYRQVPKREDLETVLAEFIKPEEE